MYPMEHIWTIVMLEICKHTFTHICREFEKWCNLRVLSGKFFWQKSCYAESFRFFWLWPQATPVTHSTARSHPGGFSHTVTISGTAVGTDQLQVLGYFLDTSTLIHYPCVFIQFLQAVLCLPDISVSVDASAITINCSKSQLSKVLQKTKTISKVKPFYNSLWHETAFVIFSTPSLLSF